MDGTGGRKCVLFSYYGIVQTRYLGVTHFVSIARRCECYPRGLRPSWGSAILYFPMRIRLLRPDRVAICTVWDVGRIRVSTFLFSGVSVRVVTFVVPVRAWHCP